MNGDTDHPKVGDADRGPSVSHHIFKFMYEVTRVNDTSYMEFVHATLAISWGIWNLQPWLPVHTIDFARVGDVRLDDIIPAVSCFYGTAALGAMAYAQSPTTRRWRKSIALRLCSFWSVVLFLHIANWYYSPSTIVYSLAILGEAWIFWRVRPYNGTP